MHDPFDFACDPVPGDFTVNGERFTVRRPTARVALQVRRALSRQPEDIFAFMTEVLGTDSERFRDMVLDLENGLEPEELTEVHEHVLALIGGGFPYWVVEVLTVTAAQEWRVMARDLAPGVLRLPFDEFLLTVYGYLIRNGDKEGIEKFDTMLFKPPAGLAKEKIEDLPMWGAASMENDFMAQLARGTTRS